MDTQRRFSELRRGHPPEGDFEGLGQSFAPIDLKVARFNRYLIPQAHE
jgi:hypothetical protein